MLKIQKVNDGELTEIKLSGRLDVNTSKELNEFIEKELSEVTKKLIFDFKDLEYISSAGLRIVLSVHKTMSGKEGLIIKNVSDSMMEIFKATAFTKFLNFE